MGAIYENCTQVVIWLGRSDDDDTEIAFWFMTRISNDIRNQGISGDGVVGQRKILCKIRKRPRTNSYL